VLAAVAGLPARARAQQTQAAPPGALVGTVTDSLTGTPRALEGAEVWLDRSPLSALTDQRGGYRLQGLPPGRYLVTFSHPLLDSLGVAPPIHEVDVAPGVDTRLDLATPASGAVVARLCGEVADSTLGVLIGTVRDVVSETPVPGAVASVSWAETVIGTGGIRRNERRVEGTTDSLGIYAVCGVPTDVAVVLRAESGRHATGLVELFLNGRRVVGRDLALSLGDSVMEVGSDAAGSGAPRLRVGTARATGTVALPNGRPAVDALVAVLGTPVTTRTDSAGAFRLGGLPAGTQTVEARTIGYAPARRAVTLRAGSVTPVAVVLDRAQELPALSIVGARGNRVQRLPEFEQRRARGMGRYLTRDQIEQRNPGEVTDLFRMMPGVSVVWDGTDYVLVSSRGAASLTSASCPLAVFLDGRPVPGDWSVNTLVRPNDVEAVEVYTGAAVPVGLSTMNGCGAVVIWTRR
jgi:hypothetical protein